MDDIENLPKDLHKNIISFLIEEIEFKDIINTKGTYWVNNFIFPDDIKNFKICYTNNDLLLNNNMLLIKNNNKYSILKYNKSRWCEGCGRDGRCRTDDCDGFLYNDYYCEKYISNLTYLKVFEEFYKRSNKNFFKKEKYVCQSMNGHL